MESEDSSERDSIGAVPLSKFPDILTVEEAARLLRVNRKTLYEVIRLNRPGMRWGRSRAE